MSVQEDSIAAFTKLFGSHPGYRVVHAKGIVCEGMFTPTREAATLSRAPHFQDHTVPVTVRFSDFTGLPGIPDGAPQASPRGIAIRFHLPGGAYTDIVGHSYNGFPVATPDAFVTFLLALATSGPDAPKPTPIEQFLGQHPAAQTFAMDPKPAPASFASESYFGVNAFRFINRDNQIRYGRYQVSPLNGTAHLSVEQAAALPADYLFDELPKRLSKGPFELQLIVQLAGEGDPLNDGSIAWPDSRPKVTMGTLTIQKVAENSEALQRQLAFNPMNLADGIEASSDPMLPVRGSTYPIASARRQANQ